MTLWGFARSIVMLSWFALIYGCFGSGLISLWSRMGSFFGQNDAQMIYSVMSMGRALGGIVSGPVSSALLEVTADRPAMRKNGVTDYGNGRYPGVVLFVGLSMSMSAVMAIAGLVLGWHHKELGNIKRKEKSMVEVREKT
jgi:hypothetical protein